MLRVDLKAAGVPYWDDRGRGFDFHSFRHSYIRNPYRGGTYGNPADVDPAFDANASDVPNRQLRAIS